MKVKCTRHTVVVVVTLASHNCMWLAKSAVVVTGCDVALPVGGGLDARRECIHPERRQRRIKIYVCKSASWSSRKNCKVLSSSKSLNSILAFASVLCYGNGGSCCCTRGTRSRIRGTHFSALH